MVKGIDVAIAILLLIPLVALLDIPSYNSVDPQIAGISFFYWYQMLWMPLATILFYIAAVLWNKRNREMKSTSRRGKRRPVVS